jgi:hypothetical protein
MNSPFDIGVSNRTTHKRVLFWKWASLWPLAERQGRLLTAFLLRHGGISGKYPTVDEGSIDIAGTGVEGVLPA